MSNPIPEKINGYNMYDEGEKLVGITGDVELPNFEPITAAISGAGILGEVESPVIGHFGSIKLTVPFRTLSKSAAKLNEPRHQQITLRADQNSYDVSQGKILHQGLKIVIGGMPVGFNAGKLKTGEGTDTQVTLEVYYIKIMLDKDVLIELDKYNYIYVVNNKDYLAEQKINM